MKELSFKPPNVFLDMSDDWNTSLVIGSKAKTPKVARNTSDLNGELGYLLLDAC